MQGVENGKPIAERGGVEEKTEGLGEDMQEGSSKEDTEGTGGDVPVTA
jgi:hypothetical protein